MKYLFSLMVVALFVQIAYCQTSTLKNKSDIVVMCDKFMQRFKERKFSDALQMLKEYSVIPADQIDSSIYSTERKIKKADSSFGKILSYDFIDERATKDYMQRFYALKFEHYVLILKFSFFKNEGEWKIVRFEYNNR
jgi:hypothetical protein